MTWVYTVEAVTSSNRKARRIVRKGEQNPRTRLSGAYSHYTAQITRWEEYGFGSPDLDTVLWQQRMFDPWLGGNAFTSTLPSNQYFDRAYAKAYGKFITDCNLGAEKSQMATNLAERMKTMEMVNNRMKQLLVGASALKKGNFRKFLETFGIKPKKGHASTRWTRPTQFSGLWLEYWFGWAPTVADINNGLKIVSNHFGGEETLRKPIIARGSSSTQISTGLTRTSNNAVWESLEGKMQVRIQADVKVSDGFALMWNQLGLMNPLTTAWELIPFSWFVGWFGNVAQVLGSMTDFVGLELSNTTVSCRTNWTNYCYTVPGYGTYAIRQIEYSSYVRALTTPFRPSLVWAIPPKLSPTRGATLASLITVLFAPSGKSKTDALKLLSRNSL